MVGVSNAIAFAPLACVLTLHPKKATQRLAPALSRPTPPPDQLEESSTRATLRGREEISTYPSILNEDTQPHVCFLQAVCGNMVGFLFGSCGEWDKEKEMMW